MRWIPLSLDLRFLGFGDDRNPRVLDEIFKIEEHRRFWDLFHCEN